MSDSQHICPMEARSKGIIHLQTYRHTSCYLNTVFNERYKWV